MQTIKDLRKEFSKTKLEKGVLEDVIKESASYYGDSDYQIEEIIEHLRNVCEEGGIHGAIHSLTYDSECKKFYIQYFDDIHELLKESNFDENVPFFAYASWFAYGAIANRILEYLENDEA